MGLKPSDIVKSLVIRHKDGSFFFALIPGDRQVSWPKLRALLGVCRLPLPSDELALEAPGYDRGTITPLGSSTPWPGYADASVQGQLVTIGAGAHGCSAFMDADELVAGLGAVSADTRDQA
ncbi:YbaK/EbsC family protein [Paeniglutamicibacter cryotolerans]|uniref:Prolyl-tRNA editing enzyme YbaK/EbsC (Cys-tRNA(Pro) deacylase) n=1 Tax=Paeniglutamicibacter cryotolerans TaxID=670079 RepID=A0A839QIX4_9MICC|nr:prolyl-tRNA editing enzyme YbaK/EbsC (Cys-tRNA(Pro) deacylase) [Paeniglutamicibacter cryotolerans]